MPFSMYQFEKNKKKPLQAQKKTGSKSFVYRITPFLTIWKRASASASRTKTRGSMTVEAAFLMSFFLLAVNLLFYFFYLMEFQVELQFAMERKVHEAAVSRAENPPGAAVLQKSVRQELMEEGKGISLGRGGVSLVENEGMEFLDVTAVFEAGPVIQLLGPMKGTYIQRCRRRLWIGQDCVGERGVQGEEAGKKYVYITQNGTVYHGRRGCAYLRPSVHPTPFLGLPGLRSKDGSRYYPCERCMKAVDALQMVYITDYGNRYHDSKNCSSLNRWVMKISVEEVEGRRPCSKCGG